MPTPDTNILNPHGISFATGLPHAVELRAPRDVMAVQGLNRWMRFALMLAARARSGSMTVLLDDGRAFRMRGDLPGPDALLQVHDHRIARALLTGGNLSFAEAYLDGACDSPDLTAVVEWATRNEEIDKALLGRPWYRWCRRLYRLLQRNSRTGSRRNISYHYDLGNDFYRRWLDTGMTYSSAVFSEADLSLEQAQEIKYRRMAELIDLRPEHHLLEIGCGWGGFAVHVARTVGCRVTGITISQQQYAYALERVQSEGLGEKITIEFRDYRDLDRRFDRAASIEMFEAVGEALWPVFFDKLRASLHPGGRAGLQVITIADQYFEAYRSSMDFIQRYVFPGGMLPSPTMLRSQAGRAGFRWLGDTGHALDYARTLRLWRQRFRAAWPEIERLGFDERFRRMWEYYLSYCEGGFRAGSIDVVQVALACD